MGRDPIKYKEYQKSYHLRTWHVRKYKHYQKRKDRVESLGIWIREYKEKLVCIKCSENNPVCLDFHHVDSSIKEGNISNMVHSGYSVKNIIKEVEKCIILCANCHRKIHGV